MLFGLDGVEIGLIIVFLCLFGGILSGFPVAFAIAGAGMLSFGIIAALDDAGVELPERAQCLCFAELDSHPSVFSELIRLLWG